MEAQAKSPVLFHVRHRDGFESVALMLSPSGNDRTVALATPAGVLTTLFGPPSVTRPLPHFDGLVHRIEDLIVAAARPYPPERTLLTTGILAQAFASKRTGQPGSQQRPADLLPRPRRTVSPNRMNRRQFLLRPRAYPASTARPAPTARKDVRF
jgi:hypothetical protein